MRRVVSAKGRVTIPKPIRDRLGIRAGDVLEFDERPDGVLVLRRLARGDPVDAVYGILRRAQGTDDLMDRLRGTGT
jgi:antitoxin PrlF